MADRLNEPSQRAEKGLPRIALEELPALAPVPICRHVHREGKVPGQCGFFLQLLLSGYPLPLLFSFRISFKAAVRRAMKPTTSDLEVVVVEGRRVVPGFVLCSVD